MDLLIAALACEEVEVWGLALHRESLGARWRDVRQHCDPKEAYFDPFIARQGWLATVGKGRKRAMRDVGQSWRGLLLVCPEIDELKRDIEAWLDQRTARQR